MPSGKNNFSLDHRSFSLSIVPNGTVTQRPTREGLDDSQALPHTIAVESHSLYALAHELSLQRHSSESLCAIACQDKIDKQQAQ